MRAVLRRIERGAPRGVSSVVTLTEVLTLPMRTGSTAVAERYRSLLLHARNFALVPVDAASAEIAASLRARHNLRTPDALQIGVAIAAGCQGFLTNDLALKRVTDLRIVILQELAV
jgi:predicted nucleic acid-binding protein